LAAARFLVAAAVALTLCLLAWFTVVPRQLSGPIDAVGYPIFADFAYDRPFWAYRLTVYVFPAIMIVAYLLLAWRGPLRKRTRIAPANAEVPVVAAEPVAGRWALFGVLVRLAVPAGLVALLAASRTARLGVSAPAAAVVYLIVVIGGAAAWAWLAAGRRGGRTIAAFWPALSMANGGAASVVALLGLWYASRHTVMVSPDGTTRVWPWMPLWLAGLGLLGVAAWTAWQLRRGRSARSVEQTLVLLVVGSVGLFLALSTLAGPLTSFQGFDDAQDKTGALLMSQGQWPWRDFLFIHGLYMDGLRASVGFPIFGATVWGANAALSLLLVPLCWVFLYWFAAWVSRSNPWLLATLAVAAVGGAFPPIEPRFITVPLSLILMGEAIRRRTIGWIIGFTLALFVQAVLLPETSFLVIAVIVCLVGADLFGRGRGAGVWASLRLTRWFVVTGAAAMLVFLAVLWSVGALTGFIDYYIVNGPGHDATGAVPPTLVGVREYGELGAIIAAVLLTIFVVVRRIRRRAAWSPQAWVGVAAAGFAALYFEKALDRFDFWHVWQVFTAALPLIIYWLWRALSLAPAALDRMPSARPWPAGLASAATGLVVVVVAAALAPHPATALRAAYQGRTVTGATASSLPRVGYAQPGALDEGLIADLDTVLRTYGGNGPVFDMTNSLGYVYFLLDREPATRFLHVSLAITPYSQRLLIDDLAKSQPPVVVYDSTAMGLPTWDGIANDVRHYMVSQYVLDHWVPVLRTHGNLILVRRDLVGSHPAVPTLRQAPVTQDLAFSGHACDWGASPNFLPAVATGASLRLAVTPVGDLTTSQRTVGQVMVPPGTDLSAYHLATLWAGQSMGASTLAITDDLGATGHAISAVSLARHGGDLPLRVGSCLQWHGFNPAKPLYVVQQGGAPVTSITLSDVTD
jgi:hypothetical protein